MSTVPHKEDCCPNCGGTNMNWGDEGRDDAHYYEDVECLDCGTTAQQYSKLVFDSWGNIRVPKTKPTRTFLCNPYTLSDHQDYVIITISPKRAKFILGLYNSLQEAFKSGAKKVLFLLPSSHSTEDIILCYDMDELENQGLELQDDCSNVDISDNMPKVEHFRLYPPMVEVTPNGCMFYAKINANPRALQNEYELRTHDFSLEELKQIAG